MTEKERFAALCRAEAPLPVSIGTYSEKRVHRVIKSFLCEDSKCHEVKIGRYVADILTEGVIYEIQTKNFKGLLPKLEYYLNNTDYDINIVFPVIAEKRLVRMDKESGEVIRSRRSSRHMGECDLAAELYGIADVWQSPRLHITAMYIACEEHRYSERRRYNKEGRYDSELFPTELLCIKDYKEAEDFSPLLPLPQSFTAGEYSSHIKRSGRACSLSLAFLLSSGLLSREREGKKYIYYRSVNGKNS